jgi:mannonate dehydratase
MKIARADVVVCRPGHNYVTLKLTTEDGLTGLGDASLLGRELAVASYLRDHVCPLLLGRDAHRIEDTWQYLHQGAYWRRGPVTMAALAAVDTALWDLKAKACGLPLYQLLGGAARDGAMVYGHAAGWDVPALLEQVAALRERGYLAIRVQAGVPGLDATYGTSPQPAPERPAASARPRESRWSSERYLRSAPDMLAAVRDAVGFDVHLLHDVHHRLTPIEAAGLGRRVEELALFWLEDPVPGELQEGYRLIRRHTTTPIAVGEALNSIWDCHRLIAEQLIDYVRVSVTHAGGISHVRRIFALAELHHVRSGSHGAADLSPVCVAAQAHLALALSNFGVVEHVARTPETDAVFPHGYRVESGYLHPGDAPGLGVELDERLAARFPYERDYAPVNRRLDGTVHPW